MTDRNRYWWRLTPLFFLGWSFLYLQRTILPPLMQTLAAEWSLSQTQLGLLNSAFFACYTILQIPAGLLADRFGRKTILIPGYLLMSLASAAGGLAQGFYSLLASRMGTGLFQGSYYSTQFSIVAAEIPQRFRTICTAIINSGAGFGMILGNALVALLVHRWGWHWSSGFFAAGLLAFLLSIAMQLLLKRDAPRSPAAPQPMSAAAKGSAATAAEPRGFWGIPGQLWLVFLLGFATMYGYFLMLTWLPSYLSLARGFSESSAGWIATVLPLGIIPGTIFFGWLSDRSGKPRRLLRLLTPLAALGLWLVMASPNDSLLYLGLFVYGISGKLVIDPMMLALISARASQETYGRTFGIFNFIGTLGMVLAPSVTGWLLDLTGQFSAAFWVAIVLQLLGFGLTFFLKELEGQPAR